MFLKLLPNTKLGINQKKWQNIYFLLIGELTKKDFSVCLMGQKSSAKALTRKLKEVARSVSYLLVTL